MLLSISLDLIHARHRFASAKACALQVAFRLLRPPSSLTGCLWHRFAQSFAVPASGSRCLSLIFDFLTRLSHLHWHRNALPSIACRSHANRFASLSCACQVLLERCAPRSFFQSRQLVCVALSTQTSPPFPKPCLRYVEFRLLRRRSKILSS